MADGGRAIGIVEMSADTIISALGQQVECYRRLAKLADLQHQHVQQCRTEELLTVLRQRQAVLDQLAELEQTVASARKRWPAFVDELDPARRQSAEMLMDEIRRLLEQITTADRNDTMVLQQRKHNLGRQIGAAAAARQVNRKYAAAAYARRGTTTDTQR